MFISGNGVYLLLLVIKVLNAVFRTQLTFHCTTQKFKIFPEGHSLKSIKEKSIITILGAILQKKILNV